MTSHTPRFRCQLSLRSGSSATYDKGKEDESAAVSNNNNILKLSPKSGVHSFAQWYRNLMDVDPNGLGLYMGSGAILKWFGRTILSKDINGFLKHNMNCCNHNITSVKVCGPINLDYPTNIKISEKTQSCDDDMEVLATPLCFDTPSKIISNSMSQVTLRSLSCKRTRSGSSSPDVYRPSKTSVIKKLKFNDDDASPPKSPCKNKPKKSPESNSAEMKKAKYNLRCNSIKKSETPTTNIDSSPSTSAGNSPIKQNMNNYINPTNLTRNYMEATCILEFTKVRNKRGADIYKWERQCKLQVGYSEDPVCVGDYIVWTIVYSDNNSCRRNLMAAFDAA